MSAEAVARLQGPDVAALVSQLCAAFFGELDAMAAEVERELSVPVPRRSDLAIEQRCHALLTDPSLKVAGAGLVMAPDVLADAAYWLEWWTANPDATPPEPRRLTAETDPRAVGFRDYTHLPWYAVPRETGSAHITGPYIDYLCTDQQTLTLTRPVRRGGEFAGVVGFDLLVRTFEEQMFAPLGRVEGACAVINTAGRVVTSSDLQWVTGDLIRGLPVEQWWAGHPATHDEWEYSACPGLPLGVITSRSGPGLAV
ncbi:MAG TPA: cache domain-containing protein [Pedococcus sp.]|nr:cache domain-containing protein [Pedococcus sp.]